MSYMIKTVKITSDWTLVTSKVALLQFNDDMYMVPGNVTEPTVKVGFKMMQNEKYINNIAGTYIWAKSIIGGSNIESVRVAEVD